MAQYTYVGHGPIVDPEGEIVHPLDVREFDEEPAWGGAWAVVGDQPVPEPAPADALSLSFAVPPVTPKGM